MIKAPIYLMRHGRTVLDVDKRSDGWLDMPLSDAGRLSLMEAQQQLKTTPLRRIYTSGLKRAQETAELVKSGTVSDPKIIVDDHGKTWNLGILAGTRKRYGRPEVEKLIEHPTEAPTGGEAFNAFRARFLPWFKKQIIAPTGNSPILYVGSGSNLRLIGKELLGNSDLLDLDEGGLACLYRQNGKWRCDVMLKPGGERNGPSDYGVEVAPS